MSSRLMGLMLALLYCAGTLLASPRHDNLVHQIEHLSRELQATPGREDLLVLRADLYRRHLQWDEALADLARVQHTRDSRDFVLTNASLYRDLGFLSAARVELDRFLLLQPEEDSVRLLRSQVLEQSAQFLAALVDLDRIIASQEFPEPDSYLARSRVASACPELEQLAIPRALAGLDEGLRRLGCLPSLQLAAIDLELRRDFHDAALERLATLARQSPRQESWLARRGDIQLAASRPEQARKSYQAALNTIGQLSPGRHATQAVQALERHVHEQLQRLEP